jgi:hypothetical protein
MSKPRLRIALVLSLLASPALLSRPTQADPITIDFSFSQAGTTVAAGSFTYDSSLQGQTLSYANLSAFDFSIEGGADYNLAFVNSVMAETGSLSFFSFNTSTDSFVGVFDGQNPTLIEAIDSSFASGFFIGDISRRNVAVDDYENFGNAPPYDTIHVSVAVPEPSSIALCGVAAAVGLTVARVRRKRGVA